MAFGLVVIEAPLPVVMPILLLLFTPTALATDDVGIEGEGATPTLPEGIWTPVVGALWITWVATDPVVPEDTRLARLGGMMGWALAGRLFGIPGAGVFCIILPVMSTDGRPGINNNVPDGCTPSLFIPGTAG